MTARIDERTTIAELGEIVAGKLGEAGIEAVLSGGAVVSIYTVNAYESSDLDFITHATLKRLAPVMESLGFRHKDRSFVHPTCRYFVEFPPAPVEIGRLPVPDEGIRIVGALRLLNPTYCVLDRLAQFIHWNDRQGLGQAVLVAARHPIELPVVEAWLAAEGYPQAIEEFRAALEDYQRRASDASGKTK